MILKAILAVITIVVGGFMLLDGTRKILTGSYFGGSLGPWSRLVSRAGFDPHRFGPVFAVLGLAWFVALAGLLLRTRWGWPAALLIAIATLWYLPIGTLLSLIYAGLLLWQRKRLTTGN